MQMKSENLKHDISNFVNGTVTDEGICKHDDQVGVPFMCMGLTHTGLTHWPLGNLNQILYI